MIMTNRIGTASDLADATCFLWGPRQFGMSTLLRSLFPAAPYYELLPIATFLRRLWADEIRAQ
jgi:hypothetical protein